MNGLRQLRMCVCVCVEGLKREMNVDREVVDGAAIYW